MRAVICGDAKPLAAAQAWAAPHVCVMTPGHLDRLPRYGHGCACGEVWGQVDEPPPGCRWEWRPTTGQTWRLATDAEVERWARGELAGCRFTVGPDKAQCHARPAVATNRAVGRGASPRWWLYCSEHLYGRRIADGVLVERVAVPVSDAPRPGR